MPGNFAKVKTAVIIVTAPLWGFLLVGYYCMFLSLFLPFYFLYVTAQQIAYAFGWTHSYTYLYMRGHHRVGIARHYRKGHTPSGLGTTEGKKADREGEGEVL